jgi:hypothetical protein
LVAQGGGQGFRCAHVDENVSVLAKQQEGNTEVEPQVDGLLLGVTRVGEMLEGGQGLLKSRDNLPVGRARIRLQTGLMAVGDGFLPHLAPERMRGEDFDLLGQPVSGECFERLHDAGMEGAPPFLKQAAVGHLVRQGVFEGVFPLRKQAGLIEQLGGLQVGQAALEHVLRRRGERP